MALWIGKTYLSGCQPTNERLRYGKSLTTRLRHKREHTQPTSKQHSKRFSLMRDLILKNCLELARSRALPRSRTWWAGCKAPEGHFGTLVRDFTSEWRRGSPMRTQFGDLSPTVLRFMRCCSRSVLRSTTWQFERKTAQSLLPIETSFLWPFICRTATSLCPMIEVNRAVCER